MRENHDEEPGAVVETTPDPDQERQLAALNVMAPDSSDLQNTSSISQSGEPVHVKNYMTASESQSRRNTIIIISSIAGVVILLFIALTIYLAVVRTPDSAYDDAITALNAMSGDARLLSDYQNATKDSTLANIDLGKFDANEADAARYSKNLAALQKLPIMQNDTTVQFGYQQAKSVIENFSPTAKSTYDSVFIFVTLVQTCQKDLSNASSSKTAKDFSSAMGDCTAYLVAQPTVPLQSLNDNQYKQYTSDLPTYIDEVEQLFGETKGSAAYNTTLGEIATTSKRGQNIDGAQGAYLGGIVSPLDQLAHLRTILEQRRNQLFR